MINLLYVFSNLSIGGAEQHLLTILRNIDPSLYKPIVCCIREKGRIGEEIEELGFSLVCLERKSKSIDLRILLDLLHLIDTRNIHIVHTHLYQACMYGRIAALIRGLPSVVTEHTAHKKYKLNRRIISRLLARKTHKVIAVSQTVKEYVIERDGIESSRIEVMHNGIDVPRYSSRLTKAEAREILRIPADGFLVGTVGRVEEQKGQMYLINAVRIVKESIPSLRALVVGSGSCEDSLKKTVSNLGLDRHVFFMGPRRDVPEILRALDVFALPSLREGLPLALLEAMASSLPVIVTPVGGIPEIVTNELNGLIVPPRDERSLAESIIALFHDNELRKKLGQTAMTTIQEKFSAQNMVSHLEHVYGSLLEGAA